MCQSLKSDLTQQHRDTSQFRDELIITALKSDQQAQCKHKYNTRNPTTDQKDCTPSSGERKPERQGPEQGRKTNERNRAIVLSPRGTKKKRERNRAIVLSHRAREKNNRKKQGYFCYPPGQGRKTTEKRAIVLSPRLTPVLSAFSNLKTERGGDHTMTTMRRMQAYQLLQAGTERVSQREKEQNMTVASQEN